MVGAGGNIRACKKSKPVFGAASTCVGAVGMLPMAASAGDLKHAWATVLCISRRDLKWQKQNLNGPSRT
jgi:hypothetical protein